MAPRMLVLDLDGTTLDSAGQLREEDRLAAHALRAAGVVVTIATGRLWGGTRWVAEALGVQGPVAVMNGSELVDVQTGVVRRGHYLDLLQTVSLREAWLEAGVLPVFFRSGGITTLPCAEALSRYLRVWDTQLDHEEALFERWVDRPPESVLALGAVGQAAVVDALAERVGPGLDRFRFRTWQGDAFLKVRVPGTDKGTALQELAAYWGLSPAEVVAVGDWTNDLPLFAAAGRSFAMAHAEPSVLAAADEVVQGLPRGGGAVAEVAERVWGVRA